MQFLRPTYENGRSQPLSPEAFDFWQQHGAPIANLLRPETPLPLSAVVEAYQDYLLENPENGIEADEVYVAWVLLTLVGYGMAEAVMPAGAYQRPRRLFSHSALPSDEIS